MARRGAIAKRQLDWITARDLQMSAFGTRWEDRERCDIAHLDLLFKLNRWRTGHD